MATILLVGTDVPLLEGLVQTLAAVGHNTRLASTLAEAMEAAALEPPLVAVVDRMLIQPMSDPLRLQLARGGTIIVYRPEGATAAALPVSIQRAVLADLTLPLERQRLVKLVQYVEGRARPTGRDVLPTPPERHPTL